MEAFPDDIEALKRLIACQTGELAVSRKELKAAKAGLAVKTLEIEKLKVQLARLQRLSFGQSSERFVREIEQLTLRLEELEATEAATAEAAALSLPAEEDLDVLPPKDAWTCQLSCRAPTWFISRRMLAAHVATSCARSARTSPRSSNTAPAASR